MSEFGDILGRKPAKAPEKSSFSRTCNMLSQYLKENKASLGDLSFGTGSNRDSGKSPAMDLFPQHTGFGNSVYTENVQKNTDLSEAKAANKSGKQMTIIYGGKVLVFDEISAEKAKELMLLTSNASLETNTSLNSNRDLDSQSIQSPIPTHVSGLPHARKASLHRFLEKRKDRINAKAPYQVITPAKADETKTWLGLSSPAL